MKLNKVLNNKLNSKDLNFFLKKKSVLLNLQILKGKLYKKKLNYKNLLFEIEEKFIELKTALTVIYSYHFFNKTILFIGVPNKIVTMLTKTKHFHIFLPSKLWLRGIFANKNSIRRYLKGQKLKKKNKMDKLITLIKIPKLIVVFEPLVNRSIIEEVYKLRLPVIALNINKIIIEKFLYKISTNSIKTDSNLNTVFLNLLTSLFVKSKYFYKLFKNKFNSPHKMPIEKILRNKIINKRK